MQALHADCGRAFDRCRAPLSDADLARRRRSPLTPEQDARLLAWGYPYVFEDFRFHMTLTGSVREPDTAARLMEALHPYFAAQCGMHRFDSVSVFRQTDRDQPFEVLRRFACEAAPAPL